MKLITHCLILFLIKSITSEISVDDFSINPFIEDLKKNGLFEMIELIKQAYGQDVAIISCEELNENRQGNCKKLVTEYMPPNPPLEIGKLIYPKSPSMIKNVMKHSCQMNFLKDLLNKKFGPEKSNILYAKIIKKVQKLSLCSKYKYNY